VARKCNSVEKHTGGGVVIKGEWQKKHGGKKRKGPEKHERTNQWRGRGGNLKGTAPN